MSKLYEIENFIYNQVPIRIWNHVFRGEDIYTSLHWHLNIELNLVTSGRILFYIDGQPYQMEKDDWNIINSGELHSNNWIEPDDHFEGIAIQISKKFMDDWVGKDVNLIYPTNKEGQKKIYDTIIKLGQIEKESGENRSLKVMEQIFHLLLLLKEYCIHKDNKKIVESKAIENIKQIILYIEKHYKEDITLTQVAHKFDYSPSYLSRMFKEHVGFNFHEYLQNVRLMNSVNMLKEEDVLIGDCALENGFPNIKSFNTIFKKTYGCTPSEWKKRVDAS